MADVVRFDIAIEANGIGVDATADSLAALAAKIDLTSKVSTTFDRAVSAARARLEEASAAAKLSAAALATAEARYKELESAANRAAKQVEKAAAAGKDTTQLQAAADAAIAKAREQGVATDALRAKALAAAEAQAKLAGTVKTLEGQQATAAASIKAGLAKELAKANEEQGKTRTLSQRLGDGLSSMGSKAGAGLKAAYAAAPAAFAAVSAAVLGSVVALGAYAIAINPAATQRLAMATERLKLNVKQLFTGIKLDGFMRALEDIMSLFERGTSSANALKLLVATILQPLLDAAAKAGPYVKEMFKGLIYGALQVVIAVLKIRNEIFKAMSPETRAAIKAFVDETVTLENAFKAGAVVAVALAVALGVLAVATLAAAWPILLVVAAIGLIVAAWAKWDVITDKITDAWYGLKKTIGDAVDGLIDGIVEGIANGASAIGKAMKDLALGALKSFKETLGIKSPSAVMRLQASYTTQGFVEGLEDGAPQVASAMDALVDPAVAGAGGTAAPAVAGGSSTSSASSRSIQIGQLTITAGGGDGPAIAEAVKRALLELMEGASLTIGGGEAPAP